MKLPFSFKHIGRAIAEIFQSKFSQTATLAWGICVIIILLVLIFSFDAYLFMQSISPPKGDTITEPKTMLTSQDIDNAIQALDTRQTQFNALLDQITGAATISF